MRESLFRSMAILGGLVAIAIAIVFHAYAARYQIVHAPANGYAVRVDRLTGEVVPCVQLTTDRGEVFRCGAMGR